MERFVRIPPSYYLEYDSLWEGLNNSSSLLAIPIYQTRVGNVEGSYGESRLHGQAPDVTVYYVVDADAFEDNPERMYNYIYLKIYKLKTDIDLPLATLQQLPSSLEMIQQLQVDFRVAKKDRDFYDETLSINEASGEIQQEDLPKIPPEQLTVETILNTMFNWIVYPPPNRQKLAILYEGIYSQFEFNHKVIQYNNLDQWNTATFVDKDSPLEPESSFITDVFIAFTELSYEDDITSIPLYQEIEEVLNDQNTFVFGSMLILLNEILTPKGLSFWINTVTPMEIGPMSLSFGGYQIPEISHHIYDVILNSTFEASRINTDHYMEIKYWDQFPEGLAIHDVINFILSHPMIRNQIFERYYLDKYDTYINIEDIYNMFYILFEAGYKLDSHTFEISANGTVTTIIELIQNYTEIEVLLSYLKQPNLQKILTELNETNILYDPLSHLDIRLNQIKQDRTIIFSDQFHYVGTEELDENYQEPRDLSETLMMMFYTDPAFAELIGPMPLEDNIQTIQNIIDGNI